MPVKIPIINERMESFLQNIQTVAMKIGKMEKHIANIIIPPVVFIILYMEFGEV